MKVRITSTMIRIIEVPNVEEGKLEELLEQLEVDYIEDESWHNMVGTEGTCRAEVVPDSTSIKQNASH